MQYYLSILILGIKVPFIIDSKISIIINKGIIIIIISLYIINRFINIIINSISYYYNIINYNYSNKEGNIYNNNIIDALNTLLYVLYATLINNNPRREGILPINSLFIDNSIPCIINNDAIYYINDSNDSNDNTNNNYSNSTSNNNNDSIDNSSNTINDYNDPIDISNNNNSNSNSNDIDDLYNDYINNMDINDYLMEDDGITMDDIIPNYTLSKKEAARLRKKDLINAKSTNIVKDMHTIINPFNVPTITPLSNHMYSKLVNITRKSDVPKDKLASIPTYVVDIFVAMLISSTGEIQVSYPPTNAKRINVTVHMTDSRAIKELHYVLANHYMMTSKLPAIKSSYMAKYKVKTFSQQICTWSMPGLDGLYHDFYNKRLLYIDKDIVTQYMTPVVFAYFVSFNVIRHNNQIRFYYYNQFMDLVIEVIKETYNINILRHEQERYHYIDTRDYYTMKQLRSIILPYTLPSMRYILKTSYNK